MKFKLHYIIFLLPFLFAFSCNEKEDQIIADYEGRLNGEWLWVNSVYNHTISGDPYILTPDTVGFTLRQIFLNDGTFHVYKNRLIESSGIYWLETVEQENDSAETKILLYTQKENFIDNAELRFSEDTLFLDNSDSDGTIKSFLKINSGL